VQKELKMIMQKNGFGLNTRNVIILFAKKDSKSAFFSACGKSNA